jgi:hypothetical protein
MRTLIALLTVLLLGASSTITVAGPISAITSDHFTITATSGCPSTGYLNVWFTSSTQFTGPTPALGDIITAIGTGGCNASGVQAQCILVIPPAAPSNKR